MSFQNLGRVRLHYAGLWNIDKDYEILDYVYSPKSLNSDTQDLYIAVVANKGVDPTQCEDDSVWVKISITGLVPSSLRIFNASVLSKDWVEITDKDNSFPYTHYANITLDKFNKDNYVGLSLLNDDCVLFGNHGFGMPKNAITGENNVLVYSIGRPEIDVPFTFSASVAKNKSVLAATVESSTATIDVDKKSAQIVFVGNYLCSYMVDSEGNKVEADQQIEYSYDLNGNNRITFSLGKTHDKKITCGVVYSTVDENSESQLK